MHSSLEALLPESDEIWVLEPELLLPTVLPLELLPSQTPKGREFYSLSCSCHALFCFLTSLAVAVFPVSSLEGCAV